MSLQRRAEHCLARDSDPDELQVVESRGNYVFDADGKKYLDFTSAWAVGNLGWSHADVQRALRAFRGPAYVSPAFLYEPWVELAELLISLAPGRLSVCFRATGGSEAVELALQAAMLHTRREKFLALEDSYHGNAFGGISVAASESRERFPNLLRGCHLIETPLDHRALRRIETQLRRRDIAAFIMEPVGVSMGLSIPSRHFVQRLRKLCSRYGTLLIFDEVASGFFRTGRLFATEYFDVEPDLLCLGKAITAGYAPMGAMLATAKVAEDMRKHGRYYSTFGWHPLSVAAALANLRYLDRNHETLSDNCLRVSSFLEERLSQIEFRLQPKIRVLGPTAALEFPTESAAQRLQKDCRKRGLLLADEKDTVLMLEAPANVELRLVRKALDIIESCANTRHKPFHKLALSYAGTS